MSKMRMLLPLVFVATFCQMQFAGATHRALAAGGATVVAGASVYFLGPHGKPIRSARAGQSIKFAMKFRVPRSFPSGYADMRFTVFVHGKAQRTVIYGAVPHIKPGEIFRIALLATIARGWNGSIRVVGTMTLLSKPGGTSLNRVGRGTALLTIVP